MNNTYAYLLARSLDILLAGWIWRTSGITISSQIGLELRKPFPARWAVSLGSLLNRIQPNHCELAIQEDLARAVETVSLLEGIK